MRYAGHANPPRPILVRYMDYPGHGDGLRITVGTEGEIDLLLKELRGLL